MDLEKQKLLVPRVPRRAVLAGLLLPLVKTVPATREERQRLAEQNISHLPEIVLADLRARTSGVGETHFGDELAAGRFLASENELGREVSAAILELQGEGDQKIAPDLAEAQVYWLLRNSGHGQRLSRTEREAIVALSNWWPEIFEPYYDDGDGSRRTLVEEMRNYPSLQRAFERSGRQDIEVADAKSRSSD
ncbi:hypothetical protein K2P56_02405 [Patescibacteria group bacterium]|nr:hypothetical protein [Patescibacteria group bacterium]